MHDDDEQKKISTWIIWGFFSHVNGEVTKAPYNRLKLDGNNILNREEHVKEEFIEF